MVEGIWRDYRQKIVETDRKSRATTTAVLINAICCPDFPIVSFGTLKGGEFLSSPPLIIDHFRVYVHKGVALPKQDFLVLYPCKLF